MHSGMENRILAQRFHLPEADFLGQMIRAVIEDILLMEQPVQPFVVDHAVIHKRRDRIDIDRNPPGQT